MRWMSFLVLSYVVLLVQTTLARLLTFTMVSAGTVGPDLLAIVAVYVSLTVRTGTDAMLAGWGLGLAVDLTAGGGPNAVTAVGPMAVSYALAAGAVCRLREAFFRERVSTKAVLALVFCLLAHGLWVTTQSLLAWRTMTWGDYGRMAWQAALVSLYTAALVPPAHWILGKLDRFFLAAPASRTRRYH